MQTQIWKECIGDYSQDRTLLSHGISSSHSLFELVTSLCSTRLCLLADQFQGKQEECQATTLFAICVQSGIWVINILAKKVLPCESKDAEVHLIPRFTAFC